MLHGLVFFMIVLFAFAALGSIALAFGVDSRVNSSIGVGLLAAPPRSKQLWRVDLAVPLGPDARPSKWEIRLSMTLVQGFWREPRDVAVARAGAAPSTIFSWP